MGIPTILWPIRATPVVPVRASLRRRSTLARRRAARAAAWGLFFLLVSLPFIYRVLAR